jgi:transposase
LRGEPVAAVARHYGISRQAVYDWIKAPKEDPKHGFEPGKRGRPAQLTRAQRKRLARMLVQGPLVHGWETNLWTCKRIRQLIADTFGVIYHRRASRACCEKPCGSRARNPSAAPASATPKKIERFRRWVFPRIKSRARREGKILVFADASGLSLQPLVRATWAPVAHTRSGGASTEKLS